MWVFEWEAIESKEAMVQCSQEPNEMCCLVVPKVSLRRRGPSSLSDPGLSEFLSAVSYNFENPGFTLIP